MEKMTIPLLVVALILLYAFIGGLAHAICERYSGPDEEHAIHAAVWPLLMVAVVVAVAIKAGMRVGQSIKRATVPTARVVERGEKQ